MSPRAVEMPKSLCCVPQGGLGLSPGWTGTPMSFLHAGLGVSICPVAAKH